MIKMSFRTGNISINPEVVFYLYHLLVWNIADYSFYSYL